MAEQLDLDGLDAEDLKALEEVSKKGYYHARPKSEAAPAPQRLEVAEVLPAGSGKRTDFDDFQRKWDKFDGTEPDLQATGGSVSSTRVNTAAKPLPPVVADEAVVSQLLAMGFGAEESRAAALRCNNSIDAAVDYMLSGGSTSASASVMLQSAAPTEADPGNVALLLEMGFPEARARQALEACSNDIDRAVTHAADAAEKDAATLSQACNSLTQLESDVMVLESQEGMPDAKRLRVLEDVLAQTSCGLDSISVDGGEARSERRQQLERCNVLDSRLAKLRESISTEVASGEAEGTSCSSVSKAVAEEDTAAEMNASSGSKAAAQDRIAEAERLRLAGNEAFKLEDFRSAAKSYLGALELDSENVAILSNLAAAELRLEDFEAAAAHADAANSLSGGFSAKALFRKGQALQGMGRFAEACAAYEAALQVEPNDRLVRQRLQECRQASNSASPVPA